MNILNKFIWKLYKNHFLSKSHSWADKNTSIDRESTFEGYNKIYRGAIISGSNIGRFTYISNAKVSGSDIGAFCSIGPEVIIGLSSHPTNWLSTHPAFYSLTLQAGATFAKHELFQHWTRPVIGNDVWIGARAVILGGLTVGDGAIIAAGSVVTKNVEPYSIVGGVPAKLIKYRFSEHVIQQLIDWQWWNLPISVLEKIADKFTNKELWTVEVIEKIKSECIVESNKIEFLEK